MSKTLHFSVALAALILPASCPAANQSNKPVAGQSDPGATNSVPVTAITNSEFTIPSSPKVGRDPFFPHSTRIFNVPETNEQRKVDSPTPTVNLVLQGISGTAEQRFAMINGRTLAQGEQTEFVVGNDRLVLRCLQIAEDSVVVEIGNVRKELRLRSN